MSLALEKFCWRNSVFELENLKLEPFAALLSIDIIVSVRRFVFFTEKTMSIENKMAQALI